MKYLRVLVLALAGATCSAVPSAAALPTPLAIVHGDAWLTSNASYDGASWVASKPAAPSFALQMTVDNPLPYERGTAGASIWVHQPGCPTRFSGFTHPCQWQLGLAVTQFRSLVVGGHTIEVDGSGPPPYGRLIHASDGVGRWFGLATNVYGDFSGVDDARAPTWMAAINENEDAFRIRRRAPAPQAVVANNSFTTLFDLDRNGNVSIRGALGASEIEQPVADRFATRARLVKGTLTFTFPHAYAVPPVCVATSEDVPLALAVHPTATACTVTSAGGENATVDLVAIGNPR